MRLLFLFSLTLSTLQAQHHDNYWIFGFTIDIPSNTNGTLLHFENGYPEFDLEDVRHDFGGYAIVCSDSAGNLIFHTNGRQVRNRLHQIIENGDTINPGQIWLNYPDSYPSITGGLAVPAPGLPNTYYMIHTSLSDNPSLGIFFPTLYYSLIDMNANSGLGKVIEKNKILAQGELPSPVIVKHGNGRDWWLIIGDFITQRYLFFLIDPTGIYLDHQQDIAPSSLTDLGYCKASPDGNLFVNNDDSTGLWIFDFDRCSGWLSHPRVLPYQPPVFYTSSLAFSADGRFLYAGTHLVVYQVDMQTIDSTYLSFDTIGRYEYGASPSPPFYTHFLLPELAPDDKIYYTTFNQSTAFHVINRPGLPLLASDMAQRGLILPKHHDQTRCYFPNYRLGKWLDSPCDTLNFSELPDNRFEDKPWSGSHVERSDEVPRVLHLPPGFNLPSIPNGSLPRDFNPLNPRTLTQKALDDHKRILQESDTTVKYTTTRQ